MKTFKDKFLLNICFNFINNILNFSLLNFFDTVTCNAKYSQFIKIYFYKILIQSRALNKIILYYKSILLSQFIKSFK